MDPGTQISQVFETEMSMASSHSFPFFPYISLKKMLNLSPSLLFSHFCSQSVLGEEAMRSTGEGRFLPAGSSGQARR